MAFPAPAPAAAAKTGTASGTATGAKSGSAAAPQSDMVYLRASDGEDLVAGMQRVVLLPRPSTTTAATTPADAVAVGGGEGAANGARAPAMGVFPVDVSVYRAAKGSAESVERVVVVAAEGRG